MDARATRWRAIMGLKRARAVECEEERANTKSKVRLQHPARYHGPPTSRLLSYESNPKNQTALQVLQVLRLETKKSWNT